MYAKPIYHFFISVLFRVCKKNSTMLWRWPRVLIKNWLLW